MGCVAGDNILITFVVPAEVFYAKHLKVPLDDQNLLCHAGFNIFKRAILVPLPDEDWTNKMISQ